METKEIMPAVTPSWPEFNPSSQTANTTYMVTSNYAISGTLSMQANVTLIFAGGRFTGSGTVNGNNTKFFAPAVQIFDTTLNFTGTWAMDKVYPENFGDTTGSNAAPAINKALQFSNVSGCVVQLLSKEYVVTESIIIRGGTTLEGTIKAPGLLDNSQVSKYGTKISASGNFNVIVIRTTGNGANDIDCYRYAIRYVTIFTSGTGNAINISAGVNTYHITPRQGVIEDIEIHHRNSNPGYGIYISGGSYLRFERISINDCKGIIFATTVEVGTYQEFIWMRQIAINCDASIYPTPDACITINRGNNLYFTEIDVNDSKTGIWIKNTTADHGIFSLFFDRIAAVRCNKGIWINTDTNYITRLQFSNINILSTGTNNKGIEFTRTAAAIPDYYLADSVFENIITDYADSSFFAIYDENGGLYNSRILNLRTDARTQLYSGRRNNQITFVGIPSSNVVTLSSGNTIQLTNKSPFPANPIAVVSIVNQQVPLSVNTTNTRGGVSSLVLSFGSITYPVTVSYYLTGYYQV